MIGCKDSFDIGGLQEEAKLVVNCFPANHVGEDLQSPAEDTTWIEVTRSIPVRKGSAKNLWDDFLEVTDASVTYRVNGRQRNVGWKDRIYDKWNQPREHGRYFVTGPHHAGDRVEIEVVASGYTSVSAETVVGEPVPVRLNSIVEAKVYDPDLEESRDVYQLSATFTDPAVTDDYYAVRVRCKHYRETAGREDSLYSHPRILTMSEPLLLPLSKMDSFFGFDNDFYQNFYIFSDTEINGQTYTLHLNLSPNHVLSPLDIFNLRPMRYQVQLYHITPEFYHYVKSINDVDNNGLAERGFAIIEPTYSNVLGGIGMVGGYGYSESNWKTLDNNKQAND